MRPFRAEDWLESTSSPHEGPAAAWTLERPRAGDPIALSVVVQRRQTPDETDELTAEPPRQEHALPVVLHQWEDWPDPQQTQP